MDLSRRIRKRTGEKFIKGALFMCASLSVLTTVGIISVLLFETIGFFQEVSIIDFFTDTEWTPLFAEKHFGIMPLITGTLLVSFIAMCVAVPLGLLSAVYLSEYSSSRFRSTIKPILEILAGIPTVVYGYFALLFVTPILQVIFPNMSGFNALSPGIVMGIMILPMISSLSEDAMHAVPNTLREGGYALGATKFQVSVKVVIPGALSGIMSSCVLAVSRAIGETMIVTIASGQLPNLTVNPLVAIETITAYIVQVSLGDTPTGTIEYKTIFAAGMTLFIFTLALNIISHYLKERFREEYS
ncbi:MAG: phosphate ABC transporter permease subunit PstC [Deltaproteobacteria bacterium]|nr:phosphate ABC transporter permease subunit PstC [Deltaproteobacteria bacterium]